MKIKINDAKIILEKCNLTHVLIFGKNERGEQFVTTYGKTIKNGKEASEVGNRLKQLLDWPKRLCKTEAIKRICKNCVFYNPRYRFGPLINKGQCLSNQLKVSREANDRACIFMEYKE